MPSTDHSVFGHYSVHFGGTWPLRAVSNASMLEGLLNLFFHLPPILIDALLLFPFFHPSGTHENSACT